MWDDAKAAPLPEASLEIFKHSLPAEESLYEYMYNYKGLGNWLHWPQITRKESHEINALGIQIPTIDTGRYSHLMEMHIRVRYEISKAKRQQRIRFSVRFLFH